MLGTRRRGIFEQTDKLVADEARLLTLTDFGVSVGETPITIPIGTLKGRPDLGNVGINIKVTMELRNCDDMYEPKQAERSAGCQGLNDEG
jgi:hypothetical protein